MLPKPVARKQKQQVDEVTQSTSELFELSGLASEL